MKTRALVARLLDSHVASPPMLDDVYKAANCLKQFGEAAELLHRMDDDGLFLRVHLDAFYEAVGLAPKGKPTKDHYTYEVIGRSAVDDFSGEGSGGGVSVTVLVTDALTGDKARARAVTARQAFEKGRAVLVAREKMPGR